MANIITEEEDRKFIHTANNHLFILKGGTGILRRKLKKELGESSELLERIDKLEKSIDDLTQMFKDRRSVYVPESK